MSNELTLGQKQRIFSFNLGRFLVWIPTNEGYEVTLGEAHRTGVMAHLYAIGAPARGSLALLLQSTGYKVLAEEIKKIAGDGAFLSLHQQRLAVDLNLFIRGEYQTESKAYGRLGDYWKTLHPLNRWGGDFSRPDGNHFSMENGGIK